MDDDQEIVAAVMHGDASGAGLFDQYAYELYAYCRAQLAQEADAATAVQDTFIIVSAKLPTLREPSRMRAWLFAIARDQCHGRVQGGGSRAADMTQYAEAFAASPQETQLSSLVLMALGELKASERELLELNVRHELDGADLADVLGVPRSRVMSLAAEARSRFETSLGALVAASPASEQNTGWTSLPDDTLTGRRSARDRSAAAMLGLLMAPEVPASLREDVFHLLTDPSPGPTAYRERVIRRSKSFRPNGFPVQRGPRAGFSLVGGRAMAAAAVVAVLILVGGGALFVKLSAHGSPSAATQPQVSTSTSAPAGSTNASKSRGRARSAKAGSTPASAAGGNQSAGAPSSAASAKKSKAARKSSSPAPTKTAKPTATKTAKPTPTKTKTATPAPSPTTPAPSPTTPAPSPSTTTTTPAGAQHGTASLITVLIDII